jgi:hypothetical protein
MKGWWAIFLNLQKNSETQRLALSPAFFCLKDKFVIQQTMAISNIAFSILFTLYVVATAHPISNMDVQWLNWPAGTDMKGDFSISEFISLKEQQELEENPELAQEKFDGKLYHF